MQKCQLNIINKNKERLQKKGCEKNQNFAGEEKNKKRKKSLVKGIKVELNFLIGYSKNNLFFLAIPYKEIF